MKSAIRKTMKGAASSALPRRGVGLLAAFALVALLPAQALANPATLQSPWKLNGNGFVGDANVQQAPDGTLSGSLYGDALTGYYAPGERIGVWLRVQGGKPIQAYVGQASADGAGFAGRLYTLNATSSGGGPQRNLFAFGAQRGAAQAPGLPGLPPFVPGPANLSGTHAIVGNGFAGTLQLNQAPDGTLSGSIYGQPIEGHYAAGSGTIAFIRYSAPGQPYQLFVGSVTAQGVQNGEFFALNASAGASAQRMRFGWTLQAATTASAPAQPQPPQNRLAPNGGPQGQVIVSPGVTVPPASGAAPPAPGSQPRLTFTGWQLVTGTTLRTPPGGEASTTTYCPAGKVVTGDADGGNNTVGGRITARAPLQDGTGWVNAEALDAFAASGGALPPKIICIDRPDGYRTVSASRSLAARERAEVEAVCPPGLVLIGGGTQTGREVFTASSAPRADGAAWQAYFRNDLVLPGSVSATVFAICVSDRYAASRRLAVSGESTISAGAIAGDMRAVCGGRGLSAGIYGNNTTVVYAGPGWAENPTPPRPPASWSGSAGVREGSATVGLRAICAQ